MDQYYADNPTANEVKIITILNQQMLQAEEDGDAEKPARFFTEDFTIIRASGARQGREAFLETVESNAHRGRIAEVPEIHLYHGCAVVIIRVTTSEKKDGALTIRRFWNTRVFLREEEEWRCATWQVMKIS